MTMIIGGEFEQQLKRFAEESEALQKMEFELKTKTQLHLEKFMGFVKENGLTDNFTLPQLALLAIRKSRA